MRIAYAGFMLESVTAVPVISGKREFEQRALRGDTLVERLRGTNTVAGGCLKALDEGGAVAVPVIQAEMGALGPASDEAIAFMTDEIVRGIGDAADLDGIVLFLHGACWAPGYPDVERHVIDAVRGIVPHLPIAVALDYHGNIDAWTFAGADVAVAYRHSPHIDMGQTGERATGALLRILREGRRPGLAVAKPGIVLPSILSATGLQPLAAIIAEARAMEAAGDCDISVMAGFAYADSPNTGMSVVCVDWAGQDAAEEKARHLSARLHDQRRLLMAAIPVFTVETALADVAAAPGKPGRPIVLLEHADRMNDSTHLLSALIGRKLGRVNVPFLFDPDTAAQAAQAGNGAEIAVRLGGKTSPESGGPVEARARVLWAGPKSFRVSGAMQTGKLVDLGPTALLEIGDIRVSVVSEFAFAIDGDPFYIFDEKPEDYDVILLRSKTHFRAFYEPRADRILVVDTPDLGPADVRLIPYRQLDTGALHPWRDDTAAA